MEYFTRLRFQGGTYENKRPGDWDVLGSYNSVTWLVMPEGETIEREIYADGT